MKRNSKLYFLTVASIIANTSLTIVLAAAAAYLIYKVILGG